ncbi:MAG: GtrA family protein [Patescibacteria group bacterium]
MLNLLLKYKRAVKFFIAGSVGAFTNLTLLYFFTDILGVWYLVSSSLSFAVSFLVSFFLQKFWTFSDGDKEAIYKQMGVYLAVALTNLGLNGLLMYTMVDGFEIWYLPAQIIASGLIAVESYFIYKKFIFNQAAKPEKAYEPR